MDLIKINKNNTEEIKKVIDIANNHIKNRIESYIHFKFKSYDMAMKLNKDARLTLSYDYDSCEIDFIDFINLDAIYISSIDMNDISYISKDYNNDNILEGISFYLKDVGTMSIEFNNEEIFIPTTL